MQRELCAYLQDVIDAGEAIFAFTDGLDYEAFERNDLIRAAVERKFEIIGEALSQASAFFPGSVDSVPDLKDAIGQRHRLAHGYFDVDAKILWGTKEQELRQFLEHVEGLKHAQCS